MKRATKQPETMPAEPRPLEPGEVRYMGYRSELEAELYLIRSAEGTAPWPFAHMLAEVARTAPREPGEGAPTRCCIACGSTRHHEHPRVVVKRCGECGRVKPPRKGRTR